MIFFVLGKKEDVFLRKEINNSTKLYIPPFIVLIFLTQITRYTVRRLPLIMDVWMYDKGHVRLTALRRDAMPFFPTLRCAPHWAELMRPFRAVTTVSKHLNNSTPQHLNTSTLQQLNN